MLSAEEVFMIQKVGDMRSGNSGITVGPGVLMEPSCKLVDKDWSK